MNPTQPTDPIEPELAGARRADPASGTEPALPGATLQAAMRDLDDADADVRRRAVLTLGAMGPTAMPALGRLMELTIEVEYLLDDAPESPDERSALEASSHVLVGALAGIGPSAVPELLDAVPRFAAATSPFVRALRTLASAAVDPQDPMVRLAAILTAARSGDDAQPPITEDLPTHPRADVRLAALRLLGRADLACDGMPVAPFASAAKDPDVRIRRAAIAVLARQLSNQAADVLRSALSDPDFEVRFQAATCVCFWEDHAEASLPVLVEGLGHPSAVTRGESLEGFAALGARAESVLTTILTATADPDPTVRSKAANTVAAIAPASPQIAETLIRMLRDDPDDGVLLSAAFQLGGMKGDNIPLAIAALTQRMAVNDAVRDSAARSLSRFGRQAESASDAVIACLEGADSMRTADLLTDLGAIGGARVIAASFDRIGDPSPIVRAAALRGLLQAAPLDATTLQAALAACGDAEAHVRAVAAEVLGGIGTGPCVGVLIRLLDDPEAEVLRDAAAALAQVGPAAADAVDPLIALLRGKRREEFGGLWRSEAILAVGRSGPAAASAIPLLAELTTSKFVRWRSAAETALAALRGS